MNRLLTPKAVIINRVTVTITPNIALSTSVTMVLLLSVREFFSIILIDKDFFRVIFTTP